MAKNAYRCTRGRVFTMQYTLSKFKNSQPVSSDRMNMCSGCDQQVWLIAAACAQGNAHQL